MTNRSFFVAAFSAFIQYYDYHLFGLIAAKIAKFYFPNHNYLEQIRNTYLIMAIAMLGKPIGAFYLGKIGDLHGRSANFNLSLIGTAIASLIIGIVPSYEHIGLFAALILLLARIFICALVSAGTDGIRIYTYEHISKNKQCLAVSITNIFTQGGALLASLSAWFFTQDWLPSYSWRGAFLLGSLMGLMLIIYKQNSKIEDLFSVKKQANFADFKNISTYQIIRKNWQLFIRSLIIAGVIGSTTQFYIIFFGTYNSTILKYISPSKMYFYTSIAIAIYMIFSLVAGWLADLFCRYKVCYFACAALLIVSAGHIYMAYLQQFYGVLFLATAACLPFLTMPVAAILKQSIPMVIRFRIFSLSHALGSIILSAPTSYVATSLYSKTHLNWLPIIYFMVTILLILVTLVFVQQQAKIKIQLKA